MEKVDAILEGLNDEQKNAVSCVDGPVLIVAGAGSGKTRVLTSRVAYLLAQGVEPSQVLALTFTKKAASEMKERIALMVGERRARRVVMGTFHSVFVRFLREYASELGYPQAFTIYDTSDSVSAMKACVREMGLDDKIYKPKDVLSRISMAKNNLVTVQGYRGNQALLDALGQESVEERKQNPRTENGPRLRQLKGNRGLGRVHTVTPRVAELIRPVPKLREDPRLGIAQIDDHASHEPSSTFGASRISSPRASVTRSKTSNVGLPIPCSRLQSACSDTPHSAAKFCCVILSDLRRSSTYEAISPFFIIMKYITSSPANQPAKRSFFITMKISIRFIRGIR
mgnify:CR=1 FL=1